MSALLGIVFLLLGLTSALWPRKMARFGEQLDAIGSTRRMSEVEPAEWNVLLTRVVGVALTLLGLAMFLTGVGGILAGGGAPHGSVGLLLAVCASVSG